MSSSVGDSSSSTSSVEVSTLAIPVLRACLDPQNASTDRGERSGGTCGAQAAAATSSAAAAFARATERAREREAEDDERGMLSETA